MPDDAQERDDALDHVVKNLFDVELEQLAYGRPRDEAEQRRAAAAAAELARRAAAAPARGRDAAGSSSTGPELDPARGRSAAAGREPSGVPWWRRTATVIAASVLLVIVAASVAPALSRSPELASSLEVFARDATARELELRAQLQRQGLRLSIGPRIIAEPEGAQIAVYRFILTAPSERPRNEVCVLLIDARALGAPSCTDRASFLQDGLQASLFGLSHHYFVRWGPGGGPTVTPIRHASSIPPYPSSAAAELFLTDEAGPDDRIYSELLRALYPDGRLIARLLSSTQHWDAVGTLTASADIGLWSYCIHVFRRTDDRAAQLGSSVTCAGVAAFEQGGLIAQTRTEEASLLIEWLPDGAIIAQELDAQG